MVQASRHESNTGEEGEDRGPLIIPREEEDNMNSNNNFEDSGRPGSSASGRPGSRRGITASLQPQPFDNNLVPFHLFFKLMRDKIQTGEDCSIVFERQEKNVSCFFFPIFGN